MTNLDKNKLPVIYSHDRDVERYAELFKVPVSSVMFFSEHIEGVQNKTTPVPKAKGVIASKIINFLQLIENWTQIDGA